eukprot:Rhum_TRINITY_DN16630_c0_g1::Rhum_TRINITY_DN16630_c0_g1_i1::g.163898::m.163898/K00864/glpK, GK; glycerol kinase
MPESGWYVGGLDQGTTSTRFIVYDDTLRPVASHQIKHKQITLKPGWLQHDPNEIVANTLSCIDHAYAALKQKVGLSARGTGPSIRGIGITNQRETVIVWDKRTGEPLYDAIVWCDLRCQGIVDSFTEKYGKQSLQKKTGLPASPYFSAFKLAWLMQNVPAVRDGLRDGTALIGTMDTWLLWKLTGSHATSVCNASRTFLLDINTLAWSDSLCKHFGVPRAALPEIVPNAGLFGSLLSTDLKGTQVTGMVGDQQAACIGQLCFKKGDVKNTYGTGCFLLMNTGDEPTLSSHGLITTVCYQLGKDARPVYALEGSVVQAGMLVTWLKDNLRLVDRVEDVERLAAMTPDSGGVSIVPAFAGLFAPHWRPDARGVICGLTMYTKREHICRAALTSVAMQCVDVMDSMKADTGVTLTELKADGGMTQNRVMMQLQADLGLLKVSIPEDKETTALGSAICAAMGAGIYTNTDDVVKAVMKTKKPNESFTPKMDDDLRLCKTERWKKALQRSHNWVENPKL